MGCDAGVVLRIRRGDCRTVAISSRWNWASTARNSPRKRGTLRDRVRVFCDTSNPALSLSLSLAFGWAVRPCPLILDGYAFQPPLSILQTGDFATRSATYRQVVVHERGLSQARLHEQVSVCLRSQSQGHCEGSVSSTPHGNGREENDNQGPKLSGHLGMNR